MAVLVVDCMFMGACGGLGEVRAGGSRRKPHDDRCVLHSTNPRRRFVPIPYPAAEAVVIALAIHAAAGVVFAVPFVLRGAGAIYPAAKGGTWGFAS